MKSIGEMSQGELAAYVQSHLAQHGLEVVLSGGAAVCVHTNGKYVSHDLDFIPKSVLHRPKLLEAMLEIGFVEQGRHFFSQRNALFCGIPSWSPIDRL